MTAHPHPHIAPGLVGAAGWRKSSHSEGTGNNCVEVADLTNTTRSAIAIRDSKQPNGPAMLVTPAGWTSFITTVKAAESPSL